MSIKYSKGICWINDTRIPFVNEGDKSSAKPLGKTLKHKGWNTEKWLEETKEPNNKGRFTPNLLVCDDALNDGKITGGKDFNITTKKNDTINWGFNNMSDRKIKQDKGSNSRYYDLDLWFEKLINETK